MAKGMEALGVECMVKSLTTTHVVHAKRRMEEMDKVQENLIELGIRPLMSERTRESHARTVDAGVAPGDANPPSFEEAIEILSEKVIGRL
jgi:hypothetical protein